MVANLLNFLPRDERFNTDLLELVHLSNASVGHLEALIAASDEPTQDTARVLEAANGIAQRKDEAKKRYELLTEGVCRTFITPFDREDIQLLSSKLYNVPKRIEKIKERLTTHHMRSRNNDFGRMMSIIRREADVLESLIQNLIKTKNLRIVTENSALLHELEDQGDDLLGQLLKELFETEPALDARELILRKDLYDMLESVTDDYRDVANVAMRVVLKHS